MIGSRSAPVVTLGLTEIPLESAPPRLDNSKNGKRQAVTVFEATHLVVITLLNEAFAEDGGAQAGVGR